MRKSMALLIILLVAMTYVSAVGMENLYDMVVPFGRDELNVSGDVFGTDNVLDISIPVGGTLSANIGVAADYYRIAQTEDASMVLGAEASFGLGTTTTFGVQTNRNNSLTMYGIDISGLNGFIELGGTGNINFSSAGTGSLTLVLDPYIGVGVGREYSIFNIIRAELMMNYLGVVPTEKKVRAVSEVFNRAAVILNAYTDNDAELVKDYWKQVAEAMGIPDRVLDVIVIANSQEYAFELNRYAGLMHGMMAMVALNLNPELHTAWVTPFSFDAELAISGAMNDFLMEKMLYYRVWAELAAGLIGGNFEFGLNGWGRVVYLPDDYHWWVEASLNTGVRIATTVTYTLALTGEANYMLTPNFTTTAEVGISLTGGIDVEVGGTYRVW